jgi:hypothetical protein
MSSRTYIIPVGSMTLTDQKDYRMNAIAALIERASQKNIGRISDEINGLSALSTPSQRISTIKTWLQAGHTPESIDIREPQPFADFGCTVDDWQTPALIAINTFYTIFNGVVTPTLNAVRIAVWYGVAVETAGFPVSRLTWRSGGAAGNIIAEFDLEQLVNRLENIGFFSEPVVFDPTLPYSGTVRARALAGGAPSGVFCRVQPMGFIAEPAGTTNA